MKPFTTPSKGNSLSFVRVIKVEAPSKEHIAAQLEKANNNYHKFMGRIDQPVIYTR